MAKKDKPKLPKKVGGVKLPKDLRKTAQSAFKLAQNPIAREVMSAALVAGAAALTKRKVKDASAPGTTGKPANELDNLIAQGRDVGNILTQGVTALFNALTKPAENKAPSRPASPEPARVKPAAAKPTTAKPAAARRTAAMPPATRRATPPKPRAKPKPTS